MLILDEVLILLFSYFVRLPLNSSNQTEAQMKSCMIERHGSCLLCKL